MLLRLGYWPSGQEAIGQQADTLFARADLAPLGALLHGASRGPSEPIAQEVSIVRDGREIHLATVATALQGEGGAPEGLVLVLDDVTPLDSRTEGRRVA